MEFGELHMCFFISSHWGRETDKVFGGDQNPPSIGLHRTKLLDVLLGDLCRIAQEVFDDPEGNRWTLCDMICQGRE